MANLAKVACPGYPAPPTPGISLRNKYTPPNITSPMAVIEYGAVERFSGYSSIGDDYSIPLSKTGETDPVTFFKFQLRQLKRTKDVYIGVGLRSVRQVINTLHALVGDSPLAGPEFGDWSLREIFHRNSHSAFGHPVHDGASRCSYISFRLMTNFTD